MTLNISLRNPKYHHLRNKTLLPSIQKLIQITTLTCKLSCGCARRSSFSFANSSYDSTTLLTSCSYSGVSLHIIACRRQSLLLLDAPLQTIRVHTRLCPFPNMENPNSPMWKENPCQGEKRQEGTKSNRTELQSLGILAEAILKGTDLILEAATSVFGCCELRSRTLGGYWEAGGALDGYFDVVVGFSGRGHRKISLQRQRWEIWKPQER